jgi:hypothetical protein
MKYLIRPIQFLLLCFISFDIYSQGFSISDYRQAYSGELLVTKPKWDKTGTKLLVTGEHNKGLYILELNKSSIVECSGRAGIGRNALWTSENKAGYQKRDEVRIVDDTFLKSARIADTLVYINPKDKLIYLVCKQTGLLKAINTEGRLYYNPVLSTNKKMVVVHYKSDMYLLSTTNKDFSKKIGFGIASSWSPDDKYIFFFRDRSDDGHLISNSDLYAYSVSDEKIIKLTNTKDYFEMWPDISSDGKHIVFSDEKTGKIYTAEIIQNLK